MTQPTPAPVSSSAAPLPARLQRLIVPAAACLAATPAGPGLRAQNKPAGTIEGRVVVPATGENAEGARREPARLRGLAAELSLVLERHHSPMPIVKGTGRHGPLASASIH